MYVCLACLPFLSIHHTYTVWSAFTILVWSTKTRTRCVLASLSFQRSPLFKTLQPVECPLHFSVRIQHNGITVLLAAEELCVSFSEAVWRTFSLAPNACMVKSSQCRVFWETIIFESIVKPHANRVRLSAFGTALFVLSRLCVKFGWESPICVHKVKAYSQTYPDIVPVDFDIWYPASPGNNCTVG